MDENKNLPEEQRKQGEKVIEDLKKLIAEDKIDELKAQMEVIRKLAEEMSKATAGNVGGNEGEVPEAEVVEPVDAVEEDN